jgi:hypothetical protein
VPRTRFNGYDIALDEIKIVGIVKISFARWLELNLYNVACLCVVR